LGIWAWIILLLLSAALASAAKYLFFRHDRSPADYDWVFIAVGALLGGFTAHVWYPGLGPTLDGRHLVPALVQHLSSTCPALVQHLSAR
jgi:hypothetical protein